MHVSGPATDRPYRRYRAGVSEWVKVPEITALFWITKILTTAMGEATSDTMVHGISPPVAVMIGFVVFVFAMWLQFRTPRYVPWVYWFAVVMVSVFGTMAADTMHVGLGVPYVVSTALFAVVLAVIFRTWYRSEGTLSIHSINTRRREVYYWAAVLATFALGTAAGDMTATTLHLGYLASAILFSVAILIPWIAWARWGLGPITAFWTAYVLTRPLGASYADWMGVAPHRGGLGVGTAAVSVVLTLLIIACVAVMQAAWARQRAAAGDRLPPGAALPADERS